MAKKILLSLVCCAVITMSILSCIFRWFIPGYILFALAALWLAAETYVFCKKTSKFGLTAAAVTIFFGFAVWLPIALAGFGIGAAEAMIVIAAIASLTTLPFVWIK